MAIADKLQTVASGVTDIRTALKEFDSSLGAGNIRTLDDDVRAISRSTIVLMDNPRRKTWVLNNGTSTNVLSDNANVNVADVTQVIVPDAITRISDNTFKNCSNLQDLWLPTNLAYIGEQAFANTYISNIGGKSEINADYVFLNAINNTNLDNLTINAIDIRNGNCNEDTITHNGTLTLNCTTYHVLTTSTTTYGMPSYEHVVITGNLKLDGTFYTSQMSPKYGKMKSFRVSGNWEGCDQGCIGFYCTTGSLSDFEFLEIGGTVSRIAKMNSLQYGIFYVNNANSMSDHMVIHLGYNGIAGIPAMIGADKSRVIKVYVGDGSSQAADQAILNQYLADSSWATYSSKLDLWSNYTGEYKN